jgi:hypothetical protein
MKVYIVTKNTAYNGTKIIGVYSSKEAAKAKVAELGGVDNYDYDIVDEYVDE